MLGSPRRQQLTQWQAHFEIYRELIKIKTEMGMLCHETALQRSTMDGLGSACPSVRLSSPRPRTGNARLQSISRTPPARLDSVSPTHSMPEPAPPIEEPLRLPGHIATRGSP